MALRVLFSNAHTRMPFAGVGALYRALEKGHGEEHNPIFYVSNGPWNLHDLLVEFFRLNEIPLGPIYLRDWGTHLLLARKPTGTHKRMQIGQIMSFFPDVPVVLIGDSGEHDPEIFLDVVEGVPGPRRHHLHPLRRQRSQATRGTGTDRTGGSRFGHRLPRGGRHARRPQCMRPVVAWSRRRRSKR